MLPYTSVCLQHGKPEPTPGSNYRLVKVENYTKDKSLQELISLIGTGRVNTQVGQAAAWHLTDKMTWRALAAKSRGGLGGVRPASYFSVAQLYAAQRLVAIAEKRARGEKVETTQPARNSRVRRLRR